MTNAEKPKKPLNKGNFAFNKDRAKAAGRKGGKARGKQAQQERAGR